MRLHGMPDHVLLGLLGGPKVGYSPSPSMHTAALSGCRLKGQYLAIDTDPDQLSFTLGELSLAGYLGLNVTIPHKITVMNYLAGLSDEARAIGSVNTLTRVEGGFYGDNTDAEGFKAAYLDGPRDSRNLRALVLGSGGAARAVIAALKRSLIEPVITARDPEKARELAGHFSCPEPLAWDSLSGAGPFDLVVNATACSAASEFEGGAPEFLLNDKARVIDINYGRGGNHFAETAAKNKAAFHDGLAMLAHQARLSFYRWTTMDPGIATFTSSLNEFLAESEKTLH